MVRAEHTGEATAEQRKENRGNEERASAGQKNQQVSELQRKDSVQGNRMGCCTVETHDWNGKLVRYTRDHGTGELMLQSTYMKRKDGVNPRPWSREWWRERAGDCVDMMWNLLSLFYKIK